MKKIKTKKAFTIVETLVTLLAITIMIAGPLTFMSRSYTYAEFVSSRVVSLGLAQEALELATALRNSGEAEFKNVTESKCTDACEVDWNGTSDLPVFDQCSGDGCALFKGTDTLFSASGSDETGYYRYIKFKPTTAKTNIENVGLVPNGYLAEAVVWNYVDGKRVEVRLSKLIYNLTIK